MDRSEGSAWFLGRNSRCMRSFKPIDDSFGILCSELEFGMVRFSIDLRITWEIYEFSVFDATPSSVTGVGEESSCVHVDQSPSP